MKKTIPANPGARLRSIGESYIKRTCADFPQWGSALGFPEFEPLLAGSDARTHRERISFVEEMLAETESISARGLSPDDWLDRRCFISLLRSELLSLRELERWRTNPQECCDGAIGSVFELVIRHADHLEKALSAIESRLALIPDFLKNGATALRNPVPLWTRLAVQSSKGAGDFLENLGGTLSEISPFPEKTRKLVQDAVKAFGVYAAAITRKKAGKPGDFAIGRERFEFLVRERCGLDWSLPEIEAEGHRLIAEISAEIEKEGRKISGGRGKKAFQILKEVRDSWIPDAPLIESHPSLTSCVIIFQRRPTPLPELFRSSKGAFSG